MIKEKCLQEILHTYRKKNFCICIKKSKDESVSELTDFLEHNLNAKTWKDYLNNPISIPDTISFLSMEANISTLVSMLQDGLNVLIESPDEPEDIAYEALKMKYLVEKKDLKAGIVSRVFNSQTFVFIETENHNGLPIITKITELTPDFESMEPLIERFENVVSKSAYIKTEVY